MFCVKCVSLHFHLIFSVNKAQTTAATTKDRDKYEMIKACKTCKVACDMGETQHILGSIIINNSNIIFRTTVTSRKRPEDTDEPLKSHCISSV